MMLPRSFTTPRGARFAISHFCQQACHDRTITRSSLFWDRRSYVVPFNSTSPGSLCLSGDLYLVCATPIRGACRDPHLPHISRRSASTVQGQPSSTRARRTSRWGLSVRSITAGISTIILLSFGYLYVTDTRAGLHRWLAVPLLRYLYPDAEDAHHAGVAILQGLYRFGVHPRERGDQDDGAFAVEVFGHLLKNPLAISAGLDKDADIVSPLFALGPAIVEVGGVTPLPQEGNAKPRVWRIRSQRALINRYGLNSKGATHVALQLHQRLRAFTDARGYGVDEEAERLVLDGHAGVPPGSLSAGRLLAVQIAKNKDTPEHDHEAVKQDYVRCVEQLGELADIVVVNVSSPNTPGLRSLQRMEPLKNILTGVVRATKDLGRRQRPAVMVKVSPDQDTEDDIQGICEAVWQSGVDGVIVANTTRRRPRVDHSAGSLSMEEQRTLGEQGGYSGLALLEGTIDLVGRYRQVLDAPLRGEDGRAKTRKAIFASGGISNGEDVLRVRTAGASIAMIYTQMVYEGSGFITSLKRQLREQLKAVPI